MNLQVTGKRVQIGIQQVFAVFASPGISMLMALLVYSVFTAFTSYHFSTTQVPYYNYLADAFLHGQLDLRILPPSTHDLILYQGYYYLYWPPMPALMVLPLVAVLGVGVSDVVYTLVIAAINVGLVAVLLERGNRRGLYSLSRAQIGLLVIFFAFGTVTLTLAPFGRVWFTGQEVGLLWVLLAYIAALSLSGWKAFLATGLATTAAMLTRNPLALTAIWPFVYLIVQNWGEGKAKVLRDLVIGAAPIVVGVAGLAAYNYARFGNPLELGLKYHQMASIFVADFHQYGAFNLHYVPINFFYQYVAYPFPLNANTWMGGSLFLLSPLFFAAFVGLWTARPRYHAWLLGITILLVSIPIFLLMGTGWVQFGPRYTLDFIVPLLLLTAIGVQKWRFSWALLLVTASIVQYVIGTILFASQMG